jgi:hypothetical protein
MDNFDHIEWFDLGAAEIEATEPKGKYSSRRGMKRRGRRHRRR